MTQYFEVDSQLYDDQKGKEECQGDPDYSYQKCVDDQIESEILPKLGCLPPYLSDKNQCKTVLKDNTTSDYVFYNYFWHLIIILWNPKFRKPVKRPVNIKSIQLLKGNKHITLVMILGSTLGLIRK